MSTAKPRKPRGFPLTAHPNGQWCKKVRGKLHYFGAWDDPQAALNKFLEHRDYLIAGVAPPTTATTVADILNSFLGDKEAARVEGDISRRTYTEYEGICDTIANCLGSTTPVDLINVNLLALRSALGRGKKGQTVSPVTHKRLLTCARASRCTSRTIRQRRNETGERMFTAQEVQALVSAAKPQLRAMILLGINCGFGNADCGTLPIEELDLKGGFHNYWRPKTQFKRRCPLWPETVDSLRRVIRDRGSGLVFITKYGNPWWVEETRDPISFEFRKLATAIGIYRKNITTFYTLRRTFETIASTAKVNQAVVDAIMGHPPDTNDMGAVYRQRVVDDSLKQCTDHVRQWYLGQLSIA